MKLNDREWCVFLIGDLFSVKRPPARNKDNYEVGDIPFVASGSVNNGVMKCCKPLEDEKLDEAGCITVSPVDGSAFYQPYPFLGRGGAGSSILMLYADNMNLYSGQFIVPVNIPMDIWETKTVLSVKELCSPLTRTIILIISLWRIM